ncbi:MAG: phosphomannomutase/phosphoglucomutase [Propionibacteriales bacterium]|nr:MAG: phosphomannomutase/phosphoglucomutase [Propionibacteriales bacterium]
MEPHIFKANDIRGIVAGPNVEFTVDDAALLGAAWVRELRLSGKSFVMGRDMRTLGPELSSAFRDAALAAGANVIDIGLASTDMLWFASGVHQMPGVQFTASHNPSNYNGIKFCLAGALPIPADLLPRLARAAENVVQSSKSLGEYREQDMLDAYADYLHSLVELSGLRHLRVVVDAGNGMGGYTTGPVLGRLNLEIIGLYLELDGSFPNHPPNPLVPENLVDAQNAVREHDADLGLVFDGDADRCFIIDERGEVVDPSLVTALIAAQELTKHPGSGIVINSITSRSVGEAVAAAGGKLFRSRVGHTYVKDLMASKNAVFGGEHSAHYYFRDFWGADTGMLAALHVLSLRGRSHQPLSELVAGFDSYARSGEINFTVTDIPGCLAEARARFGNRGQIDTSDGLTIEAEDWWLNLRPSNTEPLLRLNVEARSADDVAELTRQVEQLLQPFERKGEN